MDKVLKEIKENNLRKEQFLSQFACRDNDAIRLYRDKKDLREEFFKDTDRIIHSKAYSRYIDKTQVFIFAENDHITHRVLHVQLVSKIARTIGKALNLNEELIEAIALGHDVGHTPFGHMGESFLDSICQDNDIGFFVHNAQGVRAFNCLENNGINLTIQTLDGILSHNGEILLGLYAPNKEKTKEMFLEELENCFKIENFSKTIRPMTLEGCVVRVSDIIAYVGRDIEDAITLGLIKREDLPKELTKILGDNNSKIVNTLVLNVIRNSLNKPCISFSPRIFNALFKLREYNFKTIYNCRKVNSDKKRLKELFYKMFEIYLKMFDKKTNSAFHEFLNGQSEEYINNTNKKRIVVDFMAGQTDSFFLRECEKYSIF